MERTCSTDDGVHLVRSTDDEVHLGVHCSTQRERETHTYRVEYTWCTSVEYAWCTSVRSTDDGVHHVL
jgi:hypothetical protein